MNYFLNNPQLISLAPFIAVPVLVHFLARAKPPKYLFSATAFVMKVVRQTIRIKRPKDRLLLACRTLLFTSLVLIFLRPVVFFRDRILGNELPKSMVVVIDRSASMAWSEGGRTRFATACEEAAAVLDRLSSQDMANIVWIDREPDAVFPEMGSNIDYLRDRLKESRCSNEFGNVTNALQLALSQLESRPGARELCIISDFQVTQWHGVSLMVPDDITVTTLGPAVEAATNGAVLSIKSDPLSPLAGETTQVVLNIGNYSNTPRNRTVIVQLDEHIVTRQVQIPAWGQGAVVLEHVFPRPGRITVSARLDEDSFGVDDWRAIMVPVRHALRVGFAGDDARTAPVLRRALQALPWVELRDIQVLDPEPANDLDLILWAGWQGGQLDALVRLKHKGMPLLIAPAPGLPLDALSRLLDRPASADAAVFELQSLDPAIGLSLVHKNHRAFALFSDGQYGDPSLAAFTQRWVVNHAPDDGRVLLAFSDGRPAVVEYTASSPVVLWLAPLAAEHSDWAAQAAFLPFFGELLGAVSGNRSVDLPDTAMPGETLSFQSTALLDDGRLYDEADHIYPVVRIDSVESGTRFVSEAVNAPGIYRLCARQECTPAQIVNFPAAESDLRTAQPPDIAKSAVHTVHNAAELNAGREGTALWKLLIWVALSLIGLECLLVALLDREEHKMARGSV